MSTGKAAEKKDAKFVIDGMTHEDHMRACAYNLIGLTFPGRRAAPPAQERNEG